ncbi:MAG: M14 family zinc carboxypeptidase [Thalassotalea sp.]
MKLKHTLIIKLISVFLCLQFGTTANATNNSNHAVDHDINKAFRYLSSYRQLEWQLRLIDRWSRTNINTGPLILNGDNDGLIDIDVSLNPYLPINTQVCGEASTPTIREAILCTNNDNLGGNTDLSKVGYSTQGRTLLAAQLGNPEGTRVLVITQQHGNEPAGTEAAMYALRWLSFSRQQSAKNILDKLNILVIVRANPDGGEPNPRACEMNPATGSVISKDCAMIRENVNPAAGGGFQANTEAGFSGVVGHGYDLNRYHFVDLLNPIRPVETQAMVATALAFQPEIILDLHGDLHKTDCVIDYTSINPGQVLGQLPTANCYQDDQPADQRLISMFADAVFSSDAEHLAQSLAVNVMEKVAGRFDGSVGRFSQIQLGSTDLSIGSPANYQLIGAINSGWETANFSSDVRADVIGFYNFAPEIGVNVGLPDASLLRKQIRINKVALIEALSSLADFKDNAPTDGNNFCDYPLATGLQVELQAEMWGPLATEGEVTIPMSPLLGIPQIVSGNCP